MGGVSPRRGPLPPVAWALAVASLPGVSVSQVRRAVLEVGPERALARAAEGQPLVPPDELPAGAAAEEATPSGAVEQYGPAVSDAPPALFEVPERPPSRDVLAARRDHARSLDVRAYWEAHRTAGVACAVLGDEAYPAEVAADREAPAVLCWRGDLGALTRPRVGMIGTRRCTSYGRDAARRMGAELATAGVAVVSGLAWGIDGAAHEGALRAEHGAPPVGVVGCGLERVYPRRHGQLWAEVGRRGLLLSEWPLDVRPAPWRFPARNRTIAGLSEVLVVVESHERGGSMTTVEAANRRDVMVMAVPGPVTSPSSGGTNALLYDGAGVARGADDVLVALGMVGPASPAHSTMAPPPGTADLLEALVAGPATLDQVVVRTGRAVDDAAAGLARLSSAGLVSTSAGWWEVRRR